MRLPGEGFVAAVERMSRALEQLASTSSATAVLEEIVCCAAGSLGLERAAMGWVDPEGVLLTQASAGLAPDAVALCARSLMQGTRSEAASWVLRRGEPLEPTLVEAMERLEATSLLALPVLVSEGTCVGVLLGPSPTPRTFSPEEIRRFGLYARLASLALERGRLMESGRTAVLQAEAAGQRLQLLADAGVLLSGSLEWEKTVAGVAQLALGSFADWCAVDFLDAHGALRRLTVQHTHPERTLLHDRLEDYTPERARPAAIADVVRTGHAQLVTGLVLPLTSSQAEPEARPHGGSGSFIIAPLAARQRTLGAMSFVRGPEREAFTDSDRALAEDLAARAGLAIDNARLLRKARAAEAESRRNAARLRILVEVDRLLAEAGLDLPAVLDVIARKVSEVIGDGCVLQLMAEDGAWLEPVTVHHPDPEARWLLAGTVHARRQRLGEGLHGGAVASGRGVLLPDVDVVGALASGGLPEYVPYLERYGPQSLLVVLLGVKGRVFGSLGVVRDVAGGSPYSDEDRMLLQSLAERAALAIEDARLYGAATEAVRLRDDFLSVAGHELKTPLSALRLQIQMLARVARDVATTPGLVERVEKAERTSQRLGALIDELLDAGRITAGRMKLEREEMDLAALTRDLVGRMSEALARAGSEVKLVADAQVMGRWDRVRLEQVVGNLLSNAAKYGRGQPMEVRVEAGQEGHARLVVKDSGIGIAPEDQERIFERFERATTDKQFNGLGLGLWICREIVTSHGGRILVRSAPGQGSTFTVELPRE